MREIIPNDVLIEFSAAAELWLKYGVASGHPREDTISTYKVHLSQWFFWCRVNNFSPKNPTDVTISRYRAYLISLKHRPNTITLSLTVIRRFYLFAYKHGISSIPTALLTKQLHCQVSINRRRSLSNKKAKALLTALPLPKTLRHKRDLLIIRLMLFEGLGRTELQRANTEDLDSSNGFVIHGKTKDRFTYLSQDTIHALQEYLNAAGKVPKEVVIVNGTDVRVTPLIFSINKAGRVGQRISRIGLNFIVNAYLDKAGIKTGNLSCYALSTFGIKKIKFSPSGA